MNAIINDKNTEYDVAEILSEMTDKLQSIIKDKNLDDPVMVGIHSAGVWIAQHLHESLNIKEELGELNINFYRDDFSRIGLHPQIQPSKLPFSLENKHIILVDDVLYTGRTIRAAMNELFDYGRPASITLAVLIDRANRELPVEAQVVGFKQVMEPDSYFKLSNDNNKLDLSIINRER
ncbi:MAG: bifunctional pyr operon transcriptional regulator/uracil phosphoribosyltransferase PyrR [Cocleimonas sp.]|nr:bifunctional pyr operon transcriptional regulator/uracil phosphoribosyltransferase PyrR [Cocleimonas sp.]